MAGPLAGMPGTEQLLLFNVLGAATWVVTMSTSGFLFASMFDSSLEYLEKASWGITLVVVGASIMCGAARRSVIKNAKH